MSDFRRLASAFDVLVRDLEMRLAAKAATVSAQQADLAQLRQFLDRPEMMSSAGYAEGLHRIVRLEVELKRMEDELATLRAGHGQAQKKRDKCLSQDRVDRAARERQQEERSLGELVSRGAGASLAQSDNG